MMLVVVSLSRNNEILAICLGRDDTDGVFVSRASVRSWRPFNRIQQATMINLPKFRRPQVSNFFSAEVFWKFENLSGFDSMQQNSRQPIALLQYFLLDYTHTCNWQGSISFSNQTEYKIVVSMSLGFSQTSLFWRKNVLIWYFQDLMAPCS